MHKLVNMLKIIFSASCGVSKIEQSDASVEREISNLTDDYTELTLYYFFIILFGISILPASDSFYGHSGRFYLIYKVYFSL